MDRNASKPGFRPTSASLKRIDAAASQLGATSHAAWLKNYIQKHRERWALDLDYVEFIDPGEASILEVGSTPPVLTIALERAGLDVVGVDLDPSRFQNAIDAHGLEILRCDIEAPPLPLDDETFGLVLFNEVFEHLRINPIHTLQELRRILRKRGTLMLSTPNVKSAMGYVNYFMRNRIGSSCPDIYNEFAKLDTLGHMGHVREYTTAEVCSFLERTGFDVRHVFYRGHHAGPVGRAFFRIVQPLRPHFTVIAERTP